MMLCLLLWESLCIQFVECKRLAIEMKRDKCVMSDL